ncbi:MAG: ABC transporter substrate-binding protein [Myxococcota bacterium]|nr:ABC transporter substrate-binding protein [Myxococcota bacterium]
MKRSLFAGVTRSLLCGAVALSACGDPMPPEEDGPIIVGLAYGTADSAAQVEGALLAAAEVNAVGGVQGRQIEVVPIDTQMDPPTARDNIERFVRDNPGVKGIVGPIRGFAAVFAAPIAHREQIPMINIGGAYLPAFRDSNPADDRYAYSVRMSRVDEARRAGIALRDVVGCNTALFIAGYVRGAEQEIVSAFESEFSGEGRELVGWHRHLPEFTDFGSTLRPYTSDPPDCIFLGVDELPGILFINSWADIGGAPTTRMIYGFEPQPELFSRYLTNPSYYEELWAMGQELNDTGPAGVRFREQYMATFGEEAPEFASARYDAMAILLLGMASATSLEGPDIRDAMIRVSRDDTSDPSERTHTAGELDFALQTAARGFDMSYQGASGRFELGPDGSAANRVFRVWRVDDVEAGEYTQVAVLEGGDGEDP